MPCGLFFCKKKVRRLKIKRSLIARAPFSGVAAKKVVRIPQKIRYQGVNFSVTAIADKAFYKNKKLEKVEIGSSVRTIGSRAFYQTKKLKFIDIRSKKLKSVGKAAFIGIQKQAKIKVPRDKKAAYVKLLAKKYG